MPDDAFMTERRKKIVKCYHCQEEIWNVLGDNLFAGMKPYPTSPELGLCPECGGTISHLTFKEHAGKEFTDYFEPRVTVFRDGLSEVQQSVFDQKSFQAQVLESMQSGHGSSDEQVRTVLGPKFCQFMDRAINTMKSRMSEENQTIFDEKPYTTKILLVLQEF